jgi:hypothetical protein
MHVLNNYRKILKHTKAFQIEGLLIAPEKIQTTTPFQYLCHAVERLIIHPQKSAYEETH